MRDFNYQKAYFIQALPAFMSLNAAQKEAFDVTAERIKDLQQIRDLSISMPEEIKAILSKLTCQELAELSRASYFVGHWKPSHTKPLFDNSKGQSWKVTNCCDQVLRGKLKTPHNIEIHDGMLRVTYSSPHCWLWEEFGLATEKNLNIFKACNPSFNEENLHDSADKLKVLCGDLWCDVDLEQDSTVYSKYQQECKEIYHTREIERVNNKYKDTLIKADKDKVDAAKELEFQLLCLNNNVSIDNLIYYTHKDMFTFGWRTPIEPQEAEKIRAVLCDSKFNYEIKETR